MGYDDLVPEDLDFEISSLESELSTLEGNRAIYGWGAGNDGYEMLAMNNDQEIDRVSSQLQRLRTLRELRPSRDDD